MNRTLTTAVFSLSWGICQLPAAAHPTLSEYVQHEVSANAGSTYIDLTVRLTFFDRLSESQEGLLDRNSDGRFSTVENTLFCKDLLKSVEKQITLHVSNQQLELLPLYDPEIKVDSQKSNRARNGRFEVHLHFFARLPQGLREGAALEVRDGLYPQFPAIANFHVAGTDGLRLAADTNGHDLSRQAHSKQPLVLRASLEVVPLKSVESTQSKPIGEGENK
jgi:hypothetical protein